jgi:plastocyanin
MRSALRTAVLLIVAAGVLVACGSGSSSDSSGGNTVEITAMNITFSTTDIRVPAGDVTFTVKNDDALEHNLTIDNGKANKDVAAHKTVKVKATLQPGTYAFHCEYHPDTMKGTIVVS